MEENDNYYKSMFYYNGYIFQIFIIILFTSHLQTISSSYVLNESKYITLQEDYFIEV